MLHKILELIQFVWNLLSFIGLVTFLSLIYKAIKNLIILRDLDRLEKSYSLGLEHAKKNLRELGFTLNKLPNEIVVELSCKGDKILSSKIRTFIKKGIGRIKGKEYFNIVIFSDMSYEEQLVFIIKKTFESVLSYEKVLGIDFRETLVLYYSYKFAFSSEKLVSKEVVNILEKEFQESRFKEVVLKLDSKPLEENITLNPPPEVRPLLDRVIIPILELKSTEISNVDDLSTIELVRIEMQDLLTKIAEGKIGVLFIGKKDPNKYLGYVNTRIHEFEGILICARGIYIAIIKDISRLIEEQLGTSKLYSQTFEGNLTDDSNKLTPYKYVLLKVK